MSKAEIEKTIMKETKNLSVDNLIEVLDFIQFLKMKKHKRARKEFFERKLNEDLSDLDKISLVHLEEEFANYKELYPREE